MKRKGKGRGGIWALLISMPVLTLILALLGAKLTMSEILSQDMIPWIACGITAICSLIFCLCCAVRVPQRKFLWGMATAAAYVCMLLLGNLLFFGIGYGNIPLILSGVFGGGILGSFLGAAKRRKIA